MPVFRLVAPEGFPCLASLVHTLIEVKTQADSRDIKRSQKHILQSSFKNGVTHTLLYFVLTSTNEMSQKKTTNCKKQHHQKKVLTSVSAWHRGFPSSDSTLQSLLGLVVYGFNLVKFHCCKVNEEVPEVEEGHVKAVDSC